MKKQKNQGVEGVYLKGVQGVDPSIKPANVISFGMTRRRAEFFVNHNGQQSR